MSNPIRFIMVGGFLGAGKTTTIATLAARFQSQGLRVGIVTNDQAADLVDTHLLRSKGFEVNEVPGSCFCCNFDGLQGAISELSKGNRPDVILAEPVGSCTDLIATIALPMQEMLGESFLISPYAVILKPSHGKRILAKSSQGGFSPQAEYIFHKQLEEADILLLNRVDELAADEVLELEQLLTKYYPEKPVIKISARQGTNIDAVAEKLLSETRTARFLMEVDYDVYAEGEAELGWLNANVQVTTDGEVGLDEIALFVVNELHEQFVENHAEVAHLKAIAQADGNLAMANSVSSETAPVLSLASGSKHQAVELIINARVAIDPVNLKAATEASLAKLEESCNVKTRVVNVSSFRPGRPVPTHRVTS